MTAMLEPRQLNDADRRILSHLREGRVTPQYIAAREGYSGSYISQRLKRFVEHDVVEKVAPALYELTSDPTTSDIGETPEGDK